MAIRNLPGCWVPYTPKGKKRTLSQTKKFYVYCHIDPRTKEIFYIGKGCGRRSHSCYSRNRAWRVLVKELKELGLNFEIRFLHINKSESEALILEEREFANCLSPILTNRRIILS